jgi:hypothetical protein
MHVQHFKNDCPHLKGAGKVSITDLPSMVGAWVQSFFQSTQAPAAHGSVTCFQCGGPHFKNGRASSFARTTPLSRFLKVPRH